MLRILQGKCPIILVVKSVKCVGSGAPGVLWSSEKTGEVTGHPGGNGTQEGEERGRWKMCWNRIKRMRRRKGIKMRKRREGRRRRRRRRMY